MPAASRPADIGETLLPGFERFEVTTGSGAAAGRVSGRLHVADPQAPVLLLLHGHPQTHLLWHRVAPALAERWTVVVPDLPGYGDSRPSPPAADGPPAMSKRSLANDLVAAMAQLGRTYGAGSPWTTYDVCAHDRGARVTHRLLLDHPETVRRAMLLDIAPTLDMYDGTTRAYATAYWHWFFLIQPEPLPERLIGADPDAYLDAVMGTARGGLGAFDEGALAAYRQALRDPEVVHLMCDDYRASAGYDLELDRADREAGRLVTTPLRVLWGEHGIVGKLFDPLALWGAVATDVTGRAVDSGHYIPEEAPGELLDEITSFLG